ncbi:MAG: DUF1513 domain-containing protein [Pseudomonadota bacterium]
MLRRRDLLIGATGAALPFASYATARSTVSVIGCCRFTNGAYAVALVDPLLRLAAAFELPERGHAIAVAPAGDKAVVIARRPGRTASVIDLREPRIVATLHSAAGRHFFGHGFFSADGERFFATENDYDNAVGTIGVYDVAAGFRRTTEWSTGGVGTHEAMLLRDQRTMAVANGGIETHPDFPREKLNLASMRSSVAYLSVDNGELLDVVERPAAFPSLSLRHLTQTNDGAVWIGAQHEDTGPAPLVFRHRRGEALAPVLSAEASAELKGYVGDIGLDSRTGTVVVSSPRGNRLVHLDVVSGAQISSVALNDVCGVSEGDRLLVSTGDGLLSDVRREQRRFDFSWDNHLVVF